MCGICGVVSSNKAHVVDKEVLLQMRDSMRHRGPDDAGLFVEPGVALGSRRLSIIDLSERGHMPMTTEDGRYVIVYNGEVYNYRELRSRQQAKGHTFRSNTDTEVLLSLYRDEGPAMLSRLNGMFALAIWDTKQRTLFLARDRLGIKPLYYALKGDVLSFASEEKALFALGQRADFDQTHWEELLCFRYVAGENTPFVGVKRLLPGHYLMWGDGKVRTRRWWNLAEQAQALRDSPPRDPTTWFRDTFDDAVRLRRISDVPVGVLLSGGLDSSCVAASLALAAGSGLASFTVRFEDKKYDEGPFALDVARKWDLEYHELTVTDNDLIARLQGASWLNDEPLVHGNDLHLWAISEYAKPRVTVLLSGEGADETLGGYIRYRPLMHPSMVNALYPVASRVPLHPVLTGRLRKLARFLSLGSHHRFVLFNACDVLPVDLQAVGMTPQGTFPYRECVLAEAQALYPDEPVRQAMYSDQHTFLCSILDRNDRMTMGASIECRVPFLDFRLVEQLAALPSSLLLSGKKGKNLLRESVGSRLPESVLTHRKWGFGVPWARYFREVQEVRSFVRELPRSEPLSGGPFDGSALRRMIDGFFAGDTRYESLIRQLVMIVAWHREYFGRIAGRESATRRAPIVQ